MKKILPFIILSLFLSLQAQRNMALLEEAYLRKDTTLLDEFLKHWERAMPPVSDSQLASYSDTIRQAYAVFKAVYRPHDIGSLGEYEWGNDIYKDKAYYVVQTNLQIYFADQVYVPKDEILQQMGRFGSLLGIDDSLTTNVDSLIDAYLKNTRNDFSRDLLMKVRFSKAKAELTHDIQNFRPQIECDGKTALCLNSEYEKILNDFLNNATSHLPGKGMERSTQEIRELTSQKKVFLESKFKIWDSHWGGYWQLRSYPQINRITFDKDMIYAQADFRMVYEGGSAVLKREGDQWKLLWATHTWIE